MGTAFSPHVKLTTCLVQYEEVQACTTLCGYTGASNLLPRRAGYLAVTHLLSNPKPFATRCCVALQPCPGPFSVIGCAPGGAPILPNRDAGALVVRTKLIVGGEVAPRLRRASWRCVSESSHFHVGDTGERPYVCETHPDRASPDDRAAQRKVVVDAADRPGAEDAGLHGEAVECRRLGLGWGVEGARAALAGDPVRAGTVRAFHPDIKKLGRIGRVGTASTATATSGPLAWAGTTCTSGPTPAGWRSSDPVRR